MDYSSMVESLDKMLKEAAAKPDGRGGQAGLRCPQPVVTVAYAAIRPQPRPSWMACHF